jgi:Flp pilus assembly protein TadG
MTKERQGLRVADVLRDGTGAVLVEFTFLLPAFLLLMFGMIQLGVVAYNYIMVTNAAAVGARTFAYGRWDSNIYNDTVTAINNASSFTANEIANLTTTFKVCTSVTAGVCSTWTPPCTANSACQSALETAWAVGATPPYPVSVEVSYACAGAISIMPTYLVNLTGFCPMASTMPEPVQ